MFGQINNDKYLPYMYLKPWMMINTNTKMLNEICHDLSMTVCHGCTNREVKSTGYWIRIFNVFFNTCSIRATTKLTKSSWFKEVLLDLIVGLWSTQHWNLIFLCICEMQFRRSKQYAKNLKIKEVHFYEHDIFFGLLILKSL